MQGVWLQLVSFVIPAKAGIHGQHEQVSLPVQIKPQIAPLGVVLLDKLDFPSAVPFLHRLFARDGISNICELFQVDQLCNTMALGGTRHQALAMFVDPLQEATRYANVERAVFLACENIDPVALLGAHSMDPRFRGDDSAEESTSLTHSGTSSLALPCRDSANQ